MAEQLLQRVVYPPCKEADEEPVLAEWCKPIKTEVGPKGEYLFTYVCLVCKGVHTSELKTMPVLAAQEAEFIQAANAALTKGTK